LLDYNLLIEYQGKQHYEYVKGLHNSKKDYIKQQKHDALKRKYAQDNNIYLLEIPHWEFNNIKNKIIKELQRLC
jgi:hypothetical protein